jgi:aspartyl-tRNA(Asn)/glutamyl-tRNA(Gln) amidotransferase subunit C
MVKKLITKADVEHVATLARLGLTEEEKEKYTEQLNSILGYAEMLNKLDTSNVPPTAHALPLQNVFREDVIGKSIPNEVATANAPDKDGNFFKVPKIV